jgi:hypothetical protein
LVAGIAHFHIHVPGTRGKTYARAHGAVHVEVTFDVEKPSGEGEVFARLDD